MGKSKFAAITGIIFLILFAGCSPGGSSSGSNPQQLIQISQATIGASQIAINETAAAEAVAIAQAQSLTAEAWLAQTAVAGSQTAEAQMIAQAATREAVAIAAEASRAAESTRQSLEVDQTAVALQMSIDEATRQAGAFNYAAAVTIQAEQTRENQRILNWEMAQAAQIKRDQSSLFWANVKQFLYAVLIVVVIGAIIVLAFLAVARVQKVNDQPVQQFRDGEQNMNILVVPRGLFSSDIRTISNPRMAAPEPAGLLAAPDQPIREMQPVPGGHMLIAGGSGSGKSSFMRWAIQYRIGQTIVVDPHAAMEEWNADRVIGRGGNFDEIAAHFLWMQAELRDRMAIRGRARNPEEIKFDPLTVLTDELPAIVTTLGKDGKQAWIEWIEQGRKFGLFVILSSQSTRVKSLGITGKGDLRDQFSAVASLGSEALRRFPELADGMTRPAILELEGKAQPQRITVPYVPPFMGSRNNGTGENFNAHPSGPIVVDQPTQPTQTAVAELKTKRGIVPADEVQRILQHWRSLEKPSLRKVSNAIYNSTGGIGFYKTRAVLEAHGIV